LVKLKIYSFLPSATEIIFALGLGEQLYGITHECDYPPEAREKKIVLESKIDTSRFTQHEIDMHVVESMTHGHGLYSINRELLKRDKPDIIITQELCDVCSVSLRDVLRTVSELSNECKVISLTPRGLYGVLDDIITVGRACNAAEKAYKLVEDLKIRIKKVEQKAKDLDRPRVFCVEWFDPIFASGHWIPEMVKICGGVDKLGRIGEDSRKISWSDIINYNPEILILMSCGFGLQRTIEDIELLRRREGWGKINAVKNNKVYATDASSYYSRPGPRLVEGLEIMAKMIHPEVFGNDLPEGAATLVKSTMIHPIQMN
jgi:iron complex transport system substrate-binding protein